MKRIFCIGICAVLILALFCSCSSKTQTENDKSIVPDIGKNDIYRVNSRRLLAKNNGSVLEKTSYYFDDKSRNSSWELFYEQNGDSINAAVLYGNDYKCYYKDGKIFLNDYGDKYYELLYFKDTYEDSVNELLMGNNFLKSVYITSHHTEKKDDGYIVTFGFTVTNDTVSEFSDWGIKLNQTMSVVYELKENFEIKNYKYYYLEGSTKKMLVEVEYFYGEDILYPEDVQKKSSTDDIVKVTVISNYGMDSEYKEEFEVARGTKVYGNQYMLDRVLYADSSMTKYWDYSNDILEDTVLYLAG